MAGIRTADPGRLVALALFFCAAFPYVSPIPTPFDTQPYALVAAVLALVVAGRGAFVPHVLVPFGIVLAIAVAQFVARAEGADALRSLVGYASVLVISLAAFATYRHLRGSHLILATQTWLAFGLAQAAISKTFGSFLLPRISTSPTRGVTSLAVEPSYYSVVCIALLVLADVLHADGRLSRNQHRLILATTIVQILLARAGLSVLLMFIYLLAKLASQAKVGQLVKGAAGLAVASWLFVRAFQDIDALRETRVGRQLDIALTDPWLLLDSDGSVADRLGHVLISHLSVLHHPLGLGPGTWSQHARDLAAQIGGLTFELSEVNLSVRTNRIMSGWGAGFFELGVGGFLLLGAFVVLMVRGWARSTGYAKQVHVSSAVTLYVVMLMAVPLAFPLFGYLLGVFAYLQHSRDRADAMTAVGS